MIAPGQSGGSLPDKVPDIGIIPATNQSVPDSAQKASPEASGSKQLPIENQSFRIPATQQSVTPGPLAGLNSPPLATEGGKEKWVDNAKGV